MLIVLAVILGGIIVFVIGYFLTEMVMNEIGRVIEAQKRKRTGIIPPIVEKKEEMKALSISGGVVAVVLGLIFFFKDTMISQLLIYCCLPLIWIIFLILASVLFDTILKPTTKSKNELPVSHKPPDPFKGYVSKPYRIHETNQNSRGSKERLFHNLLVKTRNDKELANRLIEYERKRKPKASEEDLIRNAIERWEYDNQ